MSRCTLKKNKTVLRCTEEQIRSTSQIYDYKMLTCLWERRKWQHCEPPNEDAGPLKDQALLLELSHLFSPLVSFSCEIPCIFTNSDIILFVPIVEEHKLSSFWTESSNFSILKLILLLLCSCAWCGICVRWVAQHEWQFCRMDSPLSLLRVLGVELRSPGVHRKGHFYTSSSVILKNRIRN